MRKIPTAPVQPPLVRIGAGMRRMARVAAPRGLDRPASPAPRGPVPAVPACVADTGRVRLGAGMRRG